MSKKNADLQNADKTNCRHAKASNITERRQAQNIEPFLGE
jgi:hypothetical protein